MAKTLCRRELLLFPLTLLSASPTPKAEHVRYQIDVTIAPFGLILFSRKQVGYGAANLRTLNVNAYRSITFDFGGASIPERTRGIRQIGYFEEQLNQNNTQPHSSRYFGFLSSAPEGGPSQATLEQAGATSQTCCAVQGELINGQARFSKTYQAPLPADASFSTLPALSLLMRQRLASICAKSCLAGQGPANPGKTFLSVLHEAAFGPLAQLETTCQYGHRPLRIQAKRQNISGEIVVDAKITGKSCHHFSFTCPASHEPSLPTRIEYHPKPWLRLSLVALKEIA